MAGGTTSAAVWQEDSGFTLIDLPPGTGSAQANAINGAGLVVGTAGTFGVAGIRAFIWNPADGPVGLTNTVDPVLGAGWLSITATAVSENGLIVGRAYSAATGFTAVMLTPVAEPASVLLWLAGGALLVWRLRRRASLALSGPRGRDYQGAIEPGSAFSPAAISSARECHLEPRWTVSVFLRCTPQGR